MNNNSTQQGSTSLVKKIKASTNITSALKAMLIDLYTVLSYFSTGTHTVVIYAQSIFSQRVIVEFHVELQYCKLNNWQQRKFVNGLQNN